MAGAVPLPGLVATPLGQGCSSALRTHCRYCFALSFGVCVFPDSLFYPSIPLAFPGQDNRERDVPSHSWTPRTPGARATRYSIGYSPIARRGDAGTPRTPAPRGAATQRAGTGRRRDRTDLSALSSEASPGPASSRQKSKSKKSNSIALYHSNTITHFSEERSLQWPRLTADPISQPNVTRAQNSSIERVFGVEPTVRLRGAVPSSARGVCL
jgi:hypothetical protein